MCRPWASWFLRTLLAIVSMPIATLAHGGPSIEAEPDDRCDVARPLEPGAAVSATLAREDDRDWCVFHVPARAQLCRVRASTCALSDVAGADTALALYTTCDPSGWPGSPIATDDDGCPYAALSDLEAVLAPGPHFVEVAPGASRRAGGYTLALALTCYAAEPTPLFAAARP